MCLQPIANTGAVGYGRHSKSFKTLARRCSAPSPAPFLVNNEKTLLLIFETSLSLALNRKRFFRHYRTCRLEGCGRREALEITSAAKFAGGDINGLLNFRLEGQIWCAEHPGCTIADFTLGGWSG